MTESNDISTLIEQPDGQPKRNRLALWFVFAVAAILGALIFWPANSTQKFTNDPSGILSSEFQNAAGETSTLNDFEGKPIVLNFFASWCGPCRAELPEFEEVHQATKDDITFVGVSHDTSSQTWRSFIESTPVTFPTVYQPDQQIFDKLEGVPAMPSTVFIAADGTIAYVFKGAMDKEKLQELIDIHLMEGT